MDTLTKLVIGVVGILIVLGVAYHFYDGGKTSVDKTLEKYLQGKKTRSLIPLVEVDFPDEFLNYLDTKLIPQLFDYDVAGVYNDVESGNRVKGLAKITPYYYNYLVRLQQVDDDVVVYIIDPETNNMYYYADKDKEVGGEKPFQYLANKKLCVVPGYPDSNLGSKFLKYLTKATDGEVIEPKDFVVTKNEVEFGELIISSFMGKITNVNPAFSIDYVNGEENVLASLGLGDFVVFRSGNVVCFLAQPPADDPLTDIADIEDDGSINEGDFFAEDFNSKLIQKYSIT